MPSIGLATFPPAAAREALLMIGFILMKIFCSLG
jgi:hypothetical protein